MKRTIIKALLSILNSRWLNNSPCRYGWINNLDAFSYENLASEEKQQPGITVKEVLETADRFKMCPTPKSGLTVIEGDQMREGTIWDVHELRQSLSRPTECICAYPTDTVKVCPRDGRTIIPMTLDQIRNLVESDTLSSRKDGKE